MKKFFLFYFLLLLSLILSLPKSILADEQTVPSGLNYQQIGPKVEDYVNRNKDTTAGMETAIFDTKGTIYQGNFGYINKEKKIKADDSTIFEWGSVTKLTIWISVMQQWEQGKIDLDKDIREYLPDNFFKNLRYDKPITMKDLMNHQAGFEDSTHVYLPNEGQDFEQILSTNQPKQIFEPRTTTSYSNYGAGLAAYIVERVTGQKFSDYVHEHIFQPLDMNKTAILPNFTDNEYVQKKREETNSYDAKGNSIGTARLYLGIYPIGQAASTIGDFQKFAEALLKKETLFQRKETWDTLYSPTSTYPDTDTPRNMHGFFALEYGTTLVGHGGNSLGFSSYIHLDLKNGIGMVVMTNQFSEKTYNYNLPELVFGNKRKTDQEVYQQFKPGFYRTSRYFGTGPLSILRTFPTVNYINRSSSKSILGNAYTTISHQDGQEKLSQSYATILKVSDAEVYKDYAMYILLILGVVYAFGNTIVTIISALFRRITKRKKASIPRDLKIWNLVTLLSILTFCGLLIHFYIMAITGNIGMMASWRMVGYAIIGVVLTGCVLYPFISKAKSRLSTRQFILTTLTSLSALFILSNILYWSLYQWWAL